MTGHPLLTLPGVGVLVAAKLIGETGDTGRFRSADAFAALAGVAPIPASSGQTHHLRLNRGGNRQLNRALYMIALVQASHDGAGRDYIANGPRARPGATPSGRSSDSSSGPSFGSCRKVPSRWRWPLDKIGA